MIQDIHQISTVKNYPFGQRYQLDDRVYKYARAGNTLNPDFGAKQSDWQHVAFAGIIAAAAAGTKYVTLLVGLLDGMTQNGVIAKDELANGYIVIYTHAVYAPLNYQFSRKIVANTATVAGGGAMVVTLDKPLPCALTAPGTMDCECISSIYRNVQYLPLDSPYMSIVGMPTMPATVGQFLWLQTWGPCWINPQGQVSVGPNNRKVKFGPAGDIYEQDAAIAATVKQQSAGFVLANANIPARTQGAPFVFLQISP